MWLLIDIGNSASKVALFDPMSGTDKIPGEVRRTAIIEHSAHHHTDLKQFIDGITISRAGGVSVVPTQAQLWEDALRKVTGSRLTFFNEDASLPIQLTYETPETMGNDRIAAAVAGWTRYAQPGESGVIVVDAGTAINYEVILPDGTYPGGVIAAGAGLISRALRLGTAQLPEVKPVPPPYSLGRSTETAIRSGITYGVLDSVYGMVHRLRHEAQAEMKVVTTGGYGAWLVEHLRVDWAFDKHLVLKGVSDLIRLSDG